MTMPLAVNLSVHINQRGKRDDPVPLTVEINAYDSSTLHCTARPYLYTKQATYTLPFYLDLICFALLCLTQVRAN